MDVPKKLTRMEKTDKWIKKRLRQLNRCASYISPYSDEFKEPHRLHKRSFFSCRKHNCTVCREDKTLHKRELKQQKDIQSELQGM